MFLFGSKKKNCLYFVLIFSFAYSWSALANVSDIFIENAGVSAEDLNLDKQTLIEAWNPQIVRLLNQKAAKKVDSEFDLQILFDLNLEAASVWKKLIACSGGDIEKFRSEYLEGNILCEDKSIIKEFKELYANILNWQKQERKEFSFDSKTQVPTIHPLLGQILLETYTNYRHEMRTNKHLHELFAPGDLEVSNNSTACKYATDPEKVRICNEELKPLFMGYRFTKHLLKSLNTSCLNYGFWPNMSLYLFSFYSLAGRGYVLHPALEAEEKMPPFSHPNYYEFMHGRHKVEYSVVKVRGQYQYYQSGLIFSIKGVSMQKIMREDFAKKLAEMRGKPIERKSCWQGRDRFVQRLNRKTNQIVRYSQEITLINALYAKMYRNTNSSPQSFFSFDPKWNSDTDSSDNMD